MDKYALNGINAELAEYETPFTDIAFAKEEPRDRETEGNYYSQLLPEMESPFSQFFETTSAGETASSPVAGEFVQFIGELHDTEFSNSLYEMATELEDSWSSKISNELFMGETFIPFATQQANEYFRPLAAETESMIDKVSEHFSGNNFTDNSETEIERYFSELEFDHSRFTPAQEQFFGKIFDKVKSVVKTGVNLAKKGISAIGKILPIGVILNKLKGMIKPLLEKVLKFAIGKLPKYLQPFAQNLARKFLNFETANTANESGENETPTGGELEAVQTEFDVHIANLMFSPGESEAEAIMQNYESSSDSVQRELEYESGGLSMPSLETAREQFINELKDLQAGESPAPAIERFLPVAIMALRPVIKIALSIIGRQKVINFLAGLLAKLVGKFVPSNIAQPLAASIIDIGMTAIGFETFETNKPDVAYESIVNTIQETIQNLGSMDENMLNDNEALTAGVLEAFESAASNNFPAQYIREELRTISKPGIWVLKPRTGPRHLYKKFTHVFSITIEPQVARAVTTFRGSPLAAFLIDKLGLDPSKPIQARVHLYESINGTHLSRISKYEKAPGLNQPYGWVQLHPLSQQAASLLLKESAIGKDFPPKYTCNRHHIAIGQRFYYLEISGARLRIPPPCDCHHRHKPGGKSTGPISPSRSSDIQGVINTIKSEIRLNYYFSEEDAKTVVEKLNKNDYLGAALSLRYAVRNILHGILIRNVGSKVKIINETMPELYLDNYSDQQENFAPLAAVGSLALGAGKEVLMKLVEKLIDKIADMAFRALVNYFKARAAEFKEAQAKPQDGVTVKVIWVNIPGMSSIRAIINAFRGKLSVGNVLDLALPSLPTPEIKISAGKNFD